jgi:hypothetical protein
MSLPAAMNAPRAGHRALITCTVSVLMYETATIDCPWCGSPTEVSLDCSAGSQVFVEDCMVCCAPILVSLDCDAVTGLPSRLSAVHENE